MKNTIPYKAGIVGYGYMGQIRKRILDGVNNVKVTGICDENTDTILDLEKEGISVFSNYEELIDSDIDLIFVCTPNSASPDIVIKSLKAGKHVFCEKPPGRNLQDIKNMREEEKKHPDLKLMFGFNHRYHPGILEAKKIVESGKLGNILFIKGTYGKSGGRNYLSSWRNMKEVSGGGILIDQGIHMLDLFRYFCGDFNDVSGYLSKMYWKTDVEDNAFVFLRNNKGQVATLHSSATLWKHSFKMEIFLNDAYLIVSGLLSKTGSYGRETLTIGRRQFEDESFALGNPREEMVYFDQDLSWTTEVENFIKAISEDKPVENSSSEDAFKVMEIIDKIYLKEEIIENDLTLNMDRQ